MGSIDVEKGRATLHVLPGIALTADGEPVLDSRPLTTDASDHATQVRARTVLFYLIERGGRLAVRVKDSDSPARRNFHAIDYFPIDPSWRLEARFEPYDPPRSISVPTGLPFPSCSAGRMFARYAAPSTAVRRSW